MSTSALGLALAHRYSFYDCLYLAWALEQRCDLVTADERFSNAMSATFPSIRLLRSIKL